MLDAAVKAAVDRWLSDAAVADSDKDEIRGLVAARQDHELADRFYRDLEFGTGGMRGVMGAGLNRMNVYTVGAAAQGLAAHVARQGAKAREAGVAIAYDCRRDSDRFAMRVARVLAANGIRAYIFDALRPTPELSFAVRHLRCAAGVVITASHNPPEYNGLKAYWSDGAQVVPPNDERIIEEVRRVGGFGNVRVMDEAAARSQGLLKTIGRDIDDAFLRAVDASCLNPAACRSQGAKLKIVYTPLHGTGATLIPQALSRRGFAHVLVVSEQAAPDGAFPTVKSPNPEEPAALALGIALAQRESADIVIATDPDADRAGIAVKRADGTFVTLTGNQIAALLTYYICEQLTRLVRFPKNGVVLSTIVSSDLMKEIAASYGAKVVETLTGFKWIGERLREYDEEGPPGLPSLAFLFGAEESYGYLPAGFARDKDAVTSAAFIAEAAAFAAEFGMGLHELLEDLFRRYSYFTEGTKSITLKGEAGARQIKAMMDGLRRNPPKTLGGAAVRSIGDLVSGLVRDAATGAKIGEYDLPESDVMVLTLVDGTKVIARPSGTEPKIKFYILARSKDADLAAAAAACDAKIAAITDDIDRIVKTG